MDADDVDTASRGGERQLVQLPVSLPKDWRQPGECDGREQRRLGLWTDLVIQLFIPRRQNLHTPAPVGQGLEQSLRLSGASKSGIFSWSRRHLKHRHGRLA